MAGKGGNQDEVEESQKRRNQSKKPPFALPVHPQSGRPVSWDNPRSKEFVDEGRRRLDVDLCTSSTDLCPSNSCSI